MLLSIPMAGEGIARIRQGIPSNKKNIPDPGTWLLAIGLTITTVG